MTPPSPRVLVLPKHLKLKFWPFGLALIALLLGPSSWAHLGTNTSGSWSGDRVAITTLTPASATNGLGPLEINSSNGGDAAQDGQALRVGGRTFSTGLGSYAESSVTYTLNRRFTQFTSKIGVDDEAGRSGSVRFVVIADGKTIYTSRTLTGTDSAHSVKVGVNGVRSLTLRVDSTRDGNRGDSADWADAMLVKSRYAQAAPTTSTSTTGGSTTTATTGTTTSSSTTSHTSTATSTSSSTSTQPPASTSSSTTSSQPSTTGSTSTSTATSTAGGGTTKGCASAPSSCGYPDASNTGVQSGVALKAASSCPSGSTNGQVIENLSLSNCSINVTATGVVIRNVKLTTTNPDGWAIIVRDGASATIQNVEIAGKDTGAGSVQYAVLSQTDARVTIDKADMHHCANCVQGDHVTVTNSYVHDMANPPGAHVDGILCTSVCDVVLRHNTVLNRYTQTSAIALFADFGTPRNSVVDNNLLAGGGYTTYGGGDSATGIRFTNNRFSRLYFSNGGEYGVNTSFRSSNTGNEWSGNIWDDTLTAAR
jgi:hypothetical protein